MFKEQFSKMSTFRKRAFAVALATAVASTSFNVGSYAVEAGSSANGRVITAFEELPEDILYQYLPVGSKQSDIIFPEELNVTLYSDTEEEETTEDIVIEETPEEEPAEEEPTAEETPEQAAEPDAGTTDGSTDAGAVDSGTDNTATEEPAAGETATDAGNTESGSTEETGANTGEGGSQEGSTGESTQQESTPEETNQEETTPEESGSTESTEETAADESSIKDIRSTVASVINAFKPVTVYAAEGEGEEGEPLSDSDDENKENGGEESGSDENSADGGNPEAEEPEGENAEEGSGTDNTNEEAPGENTGSSEDGSSEGNADEGNTDEGITELGDGEARVLKDVNWKLVRDESTYNRFQAVLEGDVFVYEPRISEYGLKSDVELPKIRVTIVAAEETVSEDTVSEDTVSEDTVSANSPEFSQMMIVGGVRVTVEAPEGVFPEGAVLHVTKLGDSDAEKVENYVKEDMGSSAGDGEEEEQSGAGGVNVVAFDVTITDAEGNELQPNTEFGEATVKFANVDIVENYLEAQGDEDSQGGELNVYHFNDDMESAEKLETQVDSGDKAVTVNAEHFSTYAIAATEVVEDFTGGVYGDFKFEVSGAKFKIGIEDENAVTQVVTLSINKLSGSGEATVKISMAQSSATSHQGLKITDNGIDIKTNVVLNDVKIERGSVNGAYALKLDLNMSTVKMVGDSQLDCYHGALLLKNGSDVTFEGEDTGTGSLDLNGSYSSSSGSGSIGLIDSNGSAAKVTLESGTLKVERHLGKLNLILNGGSLNYYYYAEQSYGSKVVDFQCNGGTHTIDYTLFKDRSDSNTTIKGGSIKVTQNNSFDGGSQDCIVIAGSYKLYLLQYDGAKNKKLAGVFGNSNSYAAEDGYYVDREYGVNDCYFDGDGKIYLWLKGNNICPYSVTVNDGNNVIRLVRDKENRQYGTGGTNPTHLNYAESYIYPYEGGNNGHFIGPCTLIKYVPVRSVSLDTEKLLADKSENDLATVVTLTGEGGITGGAQVDDNTFSTLFRDIIWGLYSDEECKTTVGTASAYIQYKSEADGSNIQQPTSNGKYDKPKLVICKPGIYYLKASINDGYDNNVYEVVFPIRNILAVEDINCAYESFYHSSRSDLVDEIILSSGQNYAVQLGSISFADNNRICFATNPTSATYNTISLNVINKDDNEEPAGMTYANSTIMFKYPGSYRIIATVEKGKANGDDFSKTYNVEVKDDSEFGISTNSWVYSKGDTFKNHLDSDIKATHHGTYNYSSYGYYYWQIADISNQFDKDEDGDYVLPEGTDASDYIKNVVYMDSYSNEVQANTDTIVIPKAGIYLVSMRSRYVRGDGTDGVYAYAIFQVKKKEINSSDITATKCSGTYNGQAQDALTNISVTGNNEVSFRYALDGGIDTNTVPQITNVKANGSYKCTVIIDSDSYKGSADFEVNLEPKSLTDTSIKIEDIVSQNYIGSEVKPKLVVKDSATKKTLVAGTDYEVTYQDNVKAGIGIAKAIITGKGNYKDQNNKTFDIIEFDDNNLTLLFDGLEDKKAYYIGKVKITTKEGYLISDAKDGKYSSSYTMVGDGQVTKTLYFKTTDGILIPSQEVTANIIGNIKVKYNGSETKQDWYTDDVTLTAEGYLLSTNKNGTFEESLTVTNSGKTVLYFQEVESGTILTVTKTEDIKIDRKAPSGKIEAVKESWTKFQNSKKTAAYTNEQKSVTITGSDSDSKVNKIQYFISDTFYSGQNQAESAGKGKWETYSSSAKPGLSENSLNYIYAKVTDKAGNTFYMSSEGIWYDTKAPKVTTAKATPKDTSTTVQVKATDTKGSGVKFVYVLVKKKDESKPTAKTVQSSGKKKELSAEDGKDDFEITGLTAKTGYVVYTVAEDFCKNLSEVKETKITTKETSSSSSSGTGGAGNKNAAAGADGAGGSNAAKRGVSSDSAKKGGSDSASENEGEGSDGIKNKVPFIDDASEGILTGREYTSGWDKIENEALSAQAPAEIHIEMNGATVVPAKMLNDIADRDVTMYFEMGDGIIWAVNGLSFTSVPQQDIDFKVKKNTKNIPSKLLTEVADVYPHTNLTLSHDGNFGFTAIMSLDMGADNSGMFGNLYYYNEDAGSLEFIDSREIGGSGNVQFEFTHASDYTVIVRGDALTEKTAAALTVENSDSDLRDYSGKGSISGAENVAKRSNHLWLLIISIISILLCGFILFMPDKKKWQR